MLPVLFRIGAWEVHSYYVFLILGAAVGGIVGWREARRTGNVGKRILIFCAVVFPTALILGVINGWLFNLDFYSGLLRGQLVLYGGLVSYGIIFGALLSGAIYARIRQLPAGAMLDMVVLVLPLMLAFARVGCFLNGCCYGRETQGFGGLFLPDIYGRWTTRYPTQLMLIALDLGLFFWMWVGRKKKPFEGSQVIPFLFWYAAGRLVIDSLRDLPIVALGLSFHQWAAILTLVCTAIISLQRWVVKRANVFPEKTENS